MSQGKIERWRQTLKSRILLENYFLPGDLESDIAAFVVGKACEIAEQPAEPAQSSRPRFLHALPSLTPLGCDLVIEKREACVRQP